MVRDLAIHGQAAPGDWEREEARVMARARADAAAFAPLYERYFPRVYAYCVRRLGRHEDAEDVTSLIFSRALGSLRGYRGGSVAAWLFAIAHNAVANHLRGRRAHVSLDRLSPADVDDLFESRDDADAQLLRVEEQQWMARLVAALPDDDRDLLLLKVAGRLSAREIGLLVGKREGAVRVALFRIVQRLRDAHRRALAETEGTP